MWEGSVVQLGNDEKMEPMHGMHGTLDADLEVKKDTTKRAFLTAFLSLSLQKDYRPRDGSCGTTQESSMGFGEEE